MGGKCFINKTLYEVILYMELQECKKYRVLVAPEAVDLAETHRMTSLAEAFKNLGHEVIVLGKGRYDYLFADRGFQRVYIDYDEEWMDDEKFRRMHNLDEYGFDFITESELKKFVQLEVKLLKELKADVVITGFRPTMSISTKLAGVPLVWVLSAVCSDMYYEKGLATPLMLIAERTPVLKKLPRKLSNFITKKIVLNLPHKISSWNKVMKEMKLGSFSNTLKIIRGDFNLMSDAPELFPEFQDVPSYYGFCGPILMEHNIDMPDSIKKYRKVPGRPMVFFAMGSSGDPEIFKSIIAGFKDQPYDVFAASTNIVSKEDIPDIPSNVVVEKFYPAFEVTSMADVAIIHGGQGTVYTTAMAGTPFVGIPMFGEQQYNLENLSRKGCGIVLSRYNLSSATLNLSINEILNDKHFKENISKVQNKILKYKTNEKFYPPMIGAKQIINFLDNEDTSYFKVKGL